MPTPINPRDITILCLRYGIPLLQDGQGRAPVMSLEEIGEKVFLSRERVRQILARMEYRLRKATKEKLSLYCEKPIQPDADPYPTEGESDMGHACSLQVSNLDLSIRTEHVLHAARIHWVGEIVQLSEIDLIKLKGLGRKSIKEIKQVLEQLNLHLSMRLEGWEPGSVLVTELVD